MKYIFVFNLVVCSHVCMRGSGGGEGGGVLEIHPKEVVADPTSYSGVYGYNQP